MNINKLVIGGFLIIMSISYIVIYLPISAVVTPMNFIKYVFRKTSPTLFFGLYLLNTIKNHKLFKIINSFAIAISYLLLMITIKFWLGGISINDLFGIRWRYEVLLSWFLTFYGCVLSFYLKTRSINYSTYYGVFAVNGGGALYEMPNFIRQNRLIKLFTLKSINPLLISPLILALIFSAIILMNHKWKINIKLIPLIVIFIVHFTLWIFYPKIMPWWFHRIPTMILLIMLPLGLPNLHNGRNIKGNVKDG